MSSPTGAAGAAQQHRVPVGCHPADQAANTCCHPADRAAGMCDASKVGKGERAKSSRAFPKIRSGHPIDHPSRPLVRVKVGGQSAQTFPVLLSEEKYSPLHEASGYHWDFVTADFDIMDGDQKTKVEKLKDLVRNFEKSYDDHERDMCAIGTKECNYAKAHRNDWEIAQQQKLDGWKDKLTEEQRNSILAVHHNSRKK
jgi:hypothetical protein